MGQGVMRAWGRNRVKVDKMEVGSKESCQLKMERGIVRGDSLKELLVKCIIENKLELL